jgi:hypothetical protein
MNELYLSLGSGIVSGILTAMLIFFFTIIVKKWLIPMYEKISYKGFIVQGNWATRKVLEDFTYTYLLEIKQNGHDLFGTASIRKDNRAGHLEYNQGFELSGYILEGFITVNLKSNSPNSLSLATGLFQVNGRGNPIEGILTYRRNIGIGVGQEELTLERIIN